MSLILSLLLLSSSSMVTTFAFTPSPSAAASTFFSTKEAIVEMEFPALASQNAMGDGSFKSEQKMKNANNKFAKGVMDNLQSPLSILKGGPKKCLLMTSQTVPEPGITYVFVAPATYSDYSKIKSTAGTNRVILVNANCKSPTTLPAPPISVMSYFAKPITFNSELVGTLTRIHPKPWTVTTTKGKVLKTWTDEEILVPKSNTPDLRGPVKLLCDEYQRAAIAARKK